MSITFNGSSAKLTGPPLVSAFPFALFAWIKPAAAALTADQMILGVGDFGGAHECAAFGRGTLAGDPVAAFTRSGPSHSCTSAAGMTTTWQPLLIVWTSGAAVSIWYGAGAESQCVPNIPVNPALFDRLVVGTRPISDSLWWAGDCAHLAAWQGTVPDAADWAYLSTGTRPTLVKPAGLLDYWTLQTDAASQTGVNGGVLTASNTAQGADDPEINDTPPPLNDVAANGAWTWFISPVAVSDGLSKTYVGWVRATGCGVAQIDHAADNAATEFTLNGALGGDDHNNPALWIRPDGKILAVYTAHNDPSGMRVRVSSAAGDISAWSAEQLLGGDVTTTYANLTYLSDLSRLYCHYRDSAWDAALIWSDDNGDTWSSSVKLVSTSGRPYVRSFGDGVGRTDFFFTTGNPAETLNSLYHFIGKVVGGVLRFFKSDGVTEITLPVTESTASLVYDYSTLEQNCWNWDGAYGADGHPRLLFSRFATLADHRYIHARWTGSAWVLSEIAAGGGGLYAAAQQYSGGLCFDPEDAGVVYLSRDTVATGTFEIERWVTADNGATWAKDSDITTGSPAGEKNARPFPVLPPHPQARMVYWSGTYTTFNSYDTDAKIWPAEKVPAALDGTATATATATGALTTQISIAGAAASVATAAGSITTSIPLAGASAALAAAAGDLSASIRLDGAALAQALATAGLTTAIPLAGGAGGEAAGAGDLTTGGGSAALSGLAQAVATGQADLTIQIRLAGAAVAQAVAAADLTAPGQGMAGSAQAAAAASGALTTAIPITGGAASVTSADGSLTTIIPLAGAAASVSSAQGSLDLALPLSGAALAQAVAGGTLTAQIRLSGDAVAAAAASGTLAGTELQARPLRGVTAWVMAARSATFKLPSRPNTFRLRRAA